MTTVKFTRFNTIREGEFEVEGEPVGVVQNSLSTSGVFVVSVIPDEVGEIELADKNEEQTLNQLDSHKMNLAYTTGLDPDAPLTDLDGIGPARSDDVDVDAVADLPGDYDTLVAIAGAQFAQAVDRNYNLP